MPDTLVIWVGPRDFTPAEVNDILTAGYHPISLAGGFTKDCRLALFQLSTTKCSSQVGYRSDL